MLSNLGTTEILIIGAVIVLLFGGNKLPEIARGLGESQKEFKKAKKEIEKALNEDADEPAKGGEDNA